jgi:hypothetical protein
MFESYLVKRQRMIEDSDGKRKGIEKNVMFTCDSAQDCSVRVIC